MERLEENEPLETVSIRKRLKMIWIWKQFASNASLRKRDKIAIFRSVRQIQGQALNSDLFHKQKIAVKSINNGTSEM